MKQCVQQLDFFLKNVQWSFIQQCVLALKSSKIICFSNPWRPKCWWIIFFYFCFWVCLFFVYFAWVVCLFSRRNVQNHVWRRKTDLWTFNATKLKNFKISFLIKNWKIWQKSDFWTFCERSKILFMRANFLSKPFQTFC